MENETLGSALEREHREIDGGIEAFTSSPVGGEIQTEPLTRAMMGLRRHIYLEEEFLFPPLREAGLVAPIFVMLREHGEMWRTLDALDTELAGGTSSAAVLDMCRELAAQLDAHNSKEEPIIYPQADGVLTDSASAELTAFLGSGRMPAGWVCQRALS